MSTVEITDFLHQLRTGKLDVASPAFPQTLSAADFLRPVRSRYPIVFQERSIGRKHELGLAESVLFELTAHENGQQMFPLVHLLPVFRRCLLISTYDAVLSGIASIRTLRIHPAKAERSQLVVTMGSGYKLDMLPDAGWTLKKLLRRSTALSESFLRARGWQFDRLRPFVLQH